MTLERTTLHISDDSGRVAMIETRTQGTDDSAQQLQRFIYSNHLGSAALELNETGDIISYEEYHPYGTTSYQANSASINAIAKRYRYTGKERDEESGLYYHGARYYIPWLCRWSAVDPSEAKNVGQSSYCYCVCNPITHLDPYGKDAIHFFTFNVAISVSNGAGGYRKQVIESYSWAVVQKNNQPNTYTLHQSGYDLDRQTGKPVNKFNSTRALDVSKRSQNEVGENLNKDWASISRFYPSSYNDADKKSVSQSDRNSNEVFTLLNGYRNVEKSHEEGKAGVNLLIDIATLGDAAVLLDKLMSKGVTALIGKKALVNGGKDLITIGRSYEYYGGEHAVEELRMIDQPYTPPKSLNNFNNLDDLAKVFDGKDHASFATDLRKNGWTEVKGKWGSKTVYEKQVGKERYYATWESANIYPHSADGNPTSYWKLTKGKISAYGENVRRVSNASNFKNH